MFCPKGDEEELVFMSSSNGEDAFGDYIDVAFECTGDDHHRFFARVREEDIMPDD